MLLNSDAQAFAGSGSGSQGRVSSESCGAHGQAQSLLLDLPPLGTLLLRPAGWIQAWPWRRRRCLRRRRIARRSNSR